MKAVKNINLSMVITDTDGNIEYVNPKFSEVTGYSVEESIGQNPRVLKSGEMPKEVYKNTLGILSGVGIHGQESCIIRKKMASFIGNPL